VSSLTGRPTLADHDVVLELAGCGRQASLYTSEEPRPGGPTLKPERPFLWLGEALFERAGDDRPIGAAVIVSRSKW
jgi:hypothetical protein